MKENRIKNGASLVARGWLRRLNDIRLKYIEWNKTNLNKSLEKRIIKIIKIIESSSLLYYIMKLVDDWG